MCFSLTGSQSARTTSPSPSLTWTDSEIVAPIFDERNAAVKRVIARVIHKAREKGRKIGIVEQESTASLLDPDTVLKTTVAISEGRRTNRKS